MKKIKSILSIFMIIAIALGGSGCMNIYSTNGQIKMAENMLKEKYGQSFSVKAIGERFGTLTNNTYKVSCYPSDNPDVVFTAEINKKGNYIYDDYVAVCVCNKVKSIMQENLSNDIALLVVSRPSETKETDADISIEDFANNNNADFVVYAVTEKSLDDVKPDFDSVMKLLNTIDVEVRCYDEVTSEQYNKFIELSKTRNKIDSEIKFLLDELPKIISYQKGVSFYQE